MRPLALLFVVLLSLPSLKSIQAGSATWNLSPTNDWNTAENWTPATVPDAVTDVATFDVSNVTTVTIPSHVDIGGIVFNPGASAYEITADLVSVAPVSSITQVLPSILIPRKL